MSNEQLKGAPNVKRSQNCESGNVIDILALLLTKRIKKEDLSEENQAVLGFYISLMDDDPKFAAQVNTRKNQLITVGRKIPLYSPDEIKKMAKRRKRKKRKNESAFQSRLWQDESTPANETDELENIIDPEKEIFEVGKQLDDAYFHLDKNSPINEEVKQKKMKLREQIDLPTVRGNDPHVNDPFYKYLVRRICINDELEIFVEYDRVLGEVPLELNTKIEQVKELVNKFLDESLNRQQRYRMFNEFVQEYWDRWNIPK